MKKIIKLIAIATALLIITGMFSACGKKAGENNAAVTTAVTNEVVKTGIFPLIVKDANGTEMTIVKEPVKIISLTLGTDEMLLGMIDSTRIASVTPYAIDPGVSNVADAAKVITNTFLSTDAEKIIALQPDLIFVDTWADPNFIKQMRDAKITVYVFKTPNNIAEQRNTVLEIANVVGADTKGGEIVAWMDAKLKNVEDKLKSLKEENRLTIMDYSESGSGSGKGTNTDDSVTRAGLVNVIAKAGMEGWPTLNKENMVQMNPDIILLPSWYYDKSKTLDGMKAQLKSDKSLASIKAIKNDRLITVPYSHFSAISQYVVLGVEDLAAAAYPELFK